jgi:hypothetical protein
MHVWVCIHVCVVCSCTSVCLYMCSVRVVCPTPRFILYVCVCVSVHVYIHVCMCVCLYNI